MVTTDLGNPLADSVLRIVYQRPAVFRNHAPVGVDVDVPHQDQLNVERQQLQPMGIDAAQIRGHQRSRHKIGFRVRNLDRDQEFIRKAREDI